MWPLLDIPLIHLVADVAQVNVLPFVPRGSGGVDGIAFEFVHRLSKPFNISFTSRYTSSPHSPSHRGTRVVTDRPGSKSNCIRVEDVYAGVIKSEPIQVVIQGRQFSMVAGGILNSKRVRYASSSYRKRNGLPSLPTVKNVLKVLVIFHERNP